MSILEFQPNIVLNKFHKNKKGSSTKVKIATLVERVPTQLLPYGKYNTFRTSNRQDAERKYPENYSDSRNRQALQGL